MKKISRNELRGIIEESFIQDGVTDAGMVEDFFNARKQDAHDYIKRKVADILRSNASAIGDAVGALAGRTLAPYVSDYVEGIVIDEADIMGCCSADIVMRRLGFDLDALSHAR